MKRNDAIEIVGIACVFASALAVLYGLAMLATWAALIAAGGFLLVIGTGCIVLANRGGE